eukprot:239456_1
MAQKKMTKNEKAEKSPSICSEWSSTSSYGSHSSSSSSSSSSWNSYYSSSSSTTSTRSCRLMRQNGGYEEYNVLGFNGIRRVSNNAPIKEAIEIKVWTKGRRGKVLWWCAYGDTVGFDVQVHQFLKNEQEIQKQNTNNSNNNSNNKK